MGNKSSKKGLPQEDVDFLVNNTKFTKAEIKDWHRGFMRDCPDGMLSKSKFLEVYSTFFPAGNPDSFCEHVFRSFDKDNSGRIDFKEFLLAINITSGGNPQQKLNWAFDMYDIDANGTIERNEMVDIIKAIYNMLGTAMAGQDMDSPKDRTEKIFNKMDVNNDGVLTKSEFVEGCMKDQFLYQMLTADPGQ
jgi:Ca2+-binding EF-hand superfamily protein